MCVSHIVVQMCRSACLECTRVCIHAGMTHLNSCTCTCRHDAPHYQRSAVRCSVLQCAAACCSVLQRVAVRCSALQRVAIRCSVSIAILYIFLYVAVSVHNICHCERWGAGVETQKNVRGKIGGWGRVPFNETYAPSLSTIYDGA